MSVEHARSLLLVVDTNIWLDYYLAERQYHADAVELVNAAVELDAELLVPVSSLKDIFYLLQIELKRNIHATSGHVSKTDYVAIKTIAWSCLEHLVELATVVGADTSDVWIARKQRGVHDDFEDDLIIAAVQRSHADCLVTNDKRLLIHSPVTALNCVDACAFIASS